MIMTMILMMMKITIIIVIIIIIIIIIIIMSQYCFFNCVDYSLHFVMFNSVVYTV